MAITIVAVMSAALVPFAIRHVERSRESNTMEKMKKILDGMIGEHGNGYYGYLGDMGRLPNNLNELIDKGGQRDYRIGREGIGTGWNGPYVLHLGDPNSLMTDGWGTRFDYTGSAQLISAWADRVLSTDDDVNAPSDPAPTTGDVVVTVFGLPGGVVLDDNDVQRIRITYSNDGQRRRQDVEWEDPPGNWQLPGIHLGFHAITVQGRGGYSDATIVVEVRPGNNAFSVTLE